MKLVVVFKEYVSLKNLDDVSFYIKELRKMLDNDAVKEVSLYED